MPSGTMSSSRRTAEVVIDGRKGNSPEKKIVDRKGTIVIEKEKEKRNLIKPTTDNIASPPVQRQGPWTVRKLQEELRARNLSPVGKKADLLARLEGFDVSYTSSSSSSSSDSPSVRRAQQTTQQQFTSTRRLEIDFATIPSTPSTLDKLKLPELQSILKEKGLPVSGRKQDLIDRLNGAANSEDVNRSPVGSRKSSPFKDSLSSFSLEMTSPSSKNAKKSNPSTPTSKKQQQKSKISSDSEPLSLFTRPFTTLYFFFVFMLSLPGKCYKFAKEHQTKTLSIILSIILLLLVNFVPGLHSKAVEYYKGNVLWYLRWFVLGVMSSVGLGTGMHTFVLFLGPFIAEVTTAAYTCGNLNFLTTGVNAFICSSSGSASNGSSSSAAIISLLNIANKVKWEAFFWGFGTAVGELPPYFVAFASAKAGESSGIIENIQSKKGKESKLPLSQKLKILAYKFIQTFGFFGILLSASIPNPLFDLAGLTCGYFQIPFITFFSATFLGKSVIKASIQTFFVIFIFSKSNVEFVLNWLVKISPKYGSTVSQWISVQQESFKKSSSAAVTAVEKSSPLSVVWNIFMGVMIGYFLMSLVDAAATVAYQQSREVSGDSHNDTPRSKGRRLKTE